MTTSQDQESYLPVYDTVPESWEEGRMFLVEQLKRISNTVNIRVIGWLLTDELLTGKSFVPSANDTQQYRSVFVKVVDVSPLVIGANVVPHGITFDANFTLIDLKVSATNSATLNAITMSNPGNVTMNATNINITSTIAANRAYAIIEYLKEV